MPGIQHSKLSHHVNKHLKVKISSKEIPDVVVKLLVLIVKKGFAFEEE